MTEDLLFLGELFPLKEAVNLKSASFYKYTIKSLV